jgi:hypothetical protein
MAHIENRILLGEIIGWYGTFAILGAYAVSSLGFLRVDSIPAVLLNGTGALGIVYISYKKKVIQPLALNAVWALVAGITLVKLVVTG